MTRDLGPLIGAIDQGTSSTRFLVFRAQSGELVTYHQVEVHRLSPNEGWVEQDPNELFNSVVVTIERVVEKLIQMDINPQDIKGVGVTNQRESTIVWDKFTGEPFYNCIVWLDNRTSDLVNQTLDHIPSRDLNYLKSKTGLPISTYFSALKLKWLMKHVPQVKRAIREQRLLFGTVDSWLLWKLTGYHMTDVTNASRTLLMDIETLQWDPYLCEFFDIPMNVLPTIKSSSELFGKIIVGPLKGIPIAGVIGDQCAALVGQKCFQIGQAKVTYGTGCFLIQNIGPGPIHGALNGASSEAKKKLVTTVAYKLGSQPACYALEGSVAIAGAAITWLRDNLNVIDSYDQVEPLAMSNESSGGIFFVPAFQGLYAPYWDANATGTIIGLTQFSKKSHLIRATLEGIAFQTNDILTMMRQDGTGIKVDGGMAANNLLCQILADTSGWVVIRPKMCEATALGAAMLAGNALGLWDLNKVYHKDHHEEDNHLNVELDSKKIKNGEVNGGINGLNGLNGVSKKSSNGFAAMHNNHQEMNGNKHIPNGYDIDSEMMLTNQNECGAPFFEILKTSYQSLKQNFPFKSRRLSLSNSLSTGSQLLLAIEEDTANFDVFKPSIPDSLRHDKINTWKAAVARSRKWIKVEKQEQKRVEYKRLSSLPFMLFILMSFATKILSENLKDLY